MSVEKSEIPAFDSHRYVKRLIQTGMTEAQAEAVIEIHVHVLNSNLATRQDLALVHKDIEVVRKDLEMGLAGVRKDIEVVRKDLEMGLAGVRKDLEVGLAKVGANIVTVKADLTRWIAGTMVTLSALILALGAVVLSQ